MLWKLSSLHYIALHYIIFALFNCTVICLVRLNSTHCLSLGCPFTYRRFVNRSHPFGKNITVGDENATPEQCKTWCLMRSYCLAVDFNFEISTCYFLREINNDLLMVNAGVNHYQKTTCPR